MVLHGNKWRPAVVPRCKLHVEELIAVHCGSAQRTYFSRPYKAVQRLHRLLDGRVCVIAVDDVQVQIVCAQPLQRAVDLAQDGLPGEVPLVEVDLGGEDDLVAGDVAADGAAQVFFAGTR